MGSLSDLRAEFPALDDGLVFLDWGSTGLIPETSRRAVSAFMEEMAACPDGLAGWLHVRHAATRQEARKVAASLIGARADEIAIVENTTSALNGACEAVPLAAGENVILSAIDYAAVATPWKQRRLRDEIDVRFVPSEDGVIDAARIVDAIDDKTRAVSVSTLAWTTGALTDLATLGAEANMRGIVFIVDGVQSFGVVPIDVHASGIDFLAVGGHKWLNAPMGAGFLFASGKRTARLQPQRVGLLSGRPPRGSFIDWFQDPQASPEEEVLFPASARAFETGGTPCYPGGIALLESLRLFETAGVAAIAEHVRGLGARVVHGVEARGMRVITPPDPERRGGIVVFNHPDGVDAEKTLVEELRKRRVVVSVRYAGGQGGVRVCLHGMNTESDVERLLDGLDAAQAG